MKLLATVIMVLGSAVNATAQAPTIANGDFETGKDGKAARWSWWSRSGQGSAVWTDAAAHGMSHGVCLNHEGDRDWAFSSSSRIPVQAGQAFIISGWVRVKTGSIRLATVANSKGKLLNWDIGSAVASSQDTWTQIMARVEIEPPCDEIYLRFVGGGQTLAWVDDVAIAVAPPLPPVVKKPPVQGYAKTRMQEKLDRGLVAMPAADGKTYLSWRLLDSDPADVAFNVYRKGVGESFIKLNEKPLAQTTDFLDTTAAFALSTYSIKTIHHGVEGDLCPAEQAITSPAPGGAKRVPFVRIPLQGKYRAQRVGLGDLDGDGKLDYVIKQPHDNIDPYELYWKKSPDTYKLEAYNHDGKFMWRHDLGWAIERGIWYSPYLVYDLDGDGKAEVICKTGAGDPRDRDGRVQSGPEYLTILDGQTGKVRTRTDWVPREPFMKYGYNYSSRNQMCIAYLDGKTPCLIVERGTYNLIVVVAYEFKNNQLRELWRWTNEGLGRRYWGQGAHWLHAADVDGDGRDEIILGSVCLDDNGDSLWTIGLGHPDHVYVGDLDPDRPGLEIYYGMETRNPRNSMCMVDARTGKILWGHDQPTIHIHSSGLVSDLDPDHPGAECYSGERDDKEKRWLRTCKGQILDMKDRGLAPRAVYWDATPQRALLMGGRISKLHGPDLAPRLEGDVLAVADILGDWREEIITTLPGELRIYLSPLPARDRNVCLLRDPLYRMDVAGGTSGYYQIPILSYDLATRRKSAEVKGQGAEGRR